MVGFVANSSALGLTVKGWKGDQWSSPAIHGQFQGATHARVMKCADVLEKFGESLKWVMYRFPFGPVPDAGVSMPALVQLSG